MAPLEHVRVRAGLRRLCICAWKSEQGWRLTESGVEQEDCGDGHGQGWPRYLQVVFRVAFSFLLGLLSSRC